MSDLLHKEVSKKNDNSVTILNSINKGELCTFYSNIRGQS